MNNISIDTILHYILGPYGALVLAILAVIYLWRKVEQNNLDLRTALAEQKEETKAMTLDRDRWKDLYFMSMMAGERAMIAANTATSAVMTVIPPPEKPE